MLQHKGKISSVSSTTSDDSISLDLSDYTTENSYETSSISVERHYFDQPVKVTKDDIKEQLKELGYEDVSDEIIEEFMRELQVTDPNVQIVAQDDSKVLLTDSTRSRKRRSSSADISSNYSTYEDDDERQFQIHDPIKHMTLADDEKSSTSETSGNHDEETSDSEDEETESETEETDSEYEGDNEKITSASEVEYRSNKYSPSSSSASSQSSRTETPRYSHDDGEYLVKQAYSPPKLPRRLKPEVPKISSSTIHSHRPSTPQARRPPPPELDNNRPKSARARPEPMRASRSDISQAYPSPKSTERSTTRRPSFTPQRPRPKPVTYRRKDHDPVSRYQQMRKTWNKDKFLSSSNSFHGSLRWQVRKEMGVIAGHVIV